MTALRVSQDGLEGLDDLTSSAHGGVGAVRALEHEVAHLRQGLANARHIGMAIGLLAHQFSCTTDQAWALLVRLSQDSNAKAREVARVLVEGFNGQGRAEDAELMTVVTSQLPSTGRPTRGGSVRCPATTRH